MREGEVKALAAERLERITRTHKPQYIQSSKQMQGLLERAIRRLSFLESESVWQQDADDQLIMDLAGAHGLISEIVEQVKAARNPEPPCDCASCVSQKRQLN